ncbi:MAG: hypothetical protein CMJ77_10670 [Planctomycetaceae bacterium]|nr:hypothetical protein [Planctomycetaceae bacterium]
MSNLAECPVNASGRMQMTRRSFLEGRPTIECAVLFPTIGIGCKNASAWCLWNSQSTQNSIGA